MQEILGHIMRWHSHPCGSLSLPQLKGTHKRLALGREYRSDYDAILLIDQITDHKDYYAILVMLDDWHGFTADERVAAAALTGEIFRHRPN